MTGSTRGIVLRSALRIVIATILILVAVYVSLRVTSDPLDRGKAAVVDQAIALLDARGFGDDARVLRFASFRASDSWWNRRMIHASAYASTTFPFELVTLYAPFFEQPVDDTERASILLHEARHLSGKGERDAYRDVWYAKARLGWTRSSHGDSRVFRNVSAATADWVPELFRCGERNDEDCLSER